MWVIVCLMFTSLQPPKGDGRLWRRKMFIPLCGSFISGRRSHMWFLPAKSLFRYRLTSSETIIYKGLKFIKFCHVSHKVIQQETGFPFLWSNPTCLGSCQVVVLGMTPDIKWIDFSTPSRGLLPWVEGKIRQDGFATVAVVTWEHISMEKNVTSFSNKAWSTLYVGDPFWSQSTSRDRVILGFYPTVLITIIKHSACKAQYKTNIYLGLMAFYWPCATGL